MATKTLAERMAERRKKNGPPDPEKWFGKTKDAADPSEDDGDVVTFEDVKVIAETELALRVRGPWTDDQWMPKSLASVADKTLTVKRWFAKQEGLI